MVSDLSQVDKLSKDPGRGGGVPAQWKQVPTPSLLLKTGFINRQRSTAHRYISYIISHAGLTVQGHALGYKFDTATWS